MVPKDEIEEILSSDSEVCIEKEKEPGFITEAKENYKMHC
jgi:hypothetical protein